MIVVIHVAKEKEKIFPRKACREIYQTNNIILYINRRSEIKYIVLYIEEEGSKEDRKKDGTETTQAIHQKPPKFQANESKSSVWFRL